QALSYLVGHLRDAHPEPATPRFTELLELIDHRHGGLRRHGKADADRAAGRRNDRRIDADHLAVEVEQRTAGIAAIDGGVGLDVVVVGTGIDVAVARRDDAGAHPNAQTARVADGDGPFAQPQFLGAAKL